MAATVNTPTFEDATHRIAVAFGTLTFSGSYVAGGDTLDFRGKIKGSRNLLFLQINSEDGFIYKWVKGTDLSNQKVKVFGQTPTSATVGTIALDEHAAAVYEAGITGGVQRYKATYLKEL